MAKYDSDMELHYSDDASSFDVEITIVHPETGEHTSAVVDNLTSAMYFLVLNELYPIREGYQQRGEVSHSEAGNVELAPGISFAEAHKAAREVFLHDIMLTITVEGDPALIHQLAW